MRGRIEPVCHRQYLLHRTLQQGRKPTGRSDLFVRLDDINLRSRIYRWTYMCWKPMCHAHHLLLLLFASISPHHPFVATSYLHVLASLLLLPLALWRWYVVSLSHFCSPIWPRRMAR